MQNACSYCSNEAIYARDYEGVRLCSGCFRDSVEDRFRRTVVKYRMLQFDDHIAVAVSGGKDSLTLLHLLVKLETRFPRTRLTAISVDEGIDGYRDEALGLAQEACTRLGIRLLVVSYRELFGTTTDEIARLKLGQTPCAYCGVFRRKAINKAAEIAGATKIATAHNLDDEAQTVLLNLLHGDPSRIARSGPVLKDSRGVFLPRIKPLCDIPEKEIVLYAYLTGLKFQSVACPHGNEALRNDIRGFLNQMEIKHPGMKHTVLRSGEKLRTLTSPNVQLAELQACLKCGDPTPHELCEACLMLEAIAA